MRWQSLSQQAIKARAAFNHCHWQQWKHPRANNYILYWYMYIINMYVRCVYMYSAMHIVLDIQRGSSQCATLFICATSIYGSWIRETKRIQIRIRISIRIRNSQFNFNCHRFGGDWWQFKQLRRNLCYTICAMTTNTHEVFRFAKLFLWRRRQRFLIPFSAIACPPLSHATTLVSHLKWTQIVCVRFIDAHPSDTTAFDQARRRWQRRRRRTCLSALCMTVCVCVCPTQPASLSAENTYLNVNRFWTPTVAAIPADPADSLVLLPLCSLQPR